MDAFQVHRRGTYLVWTVHVLCRICHPRGSAWNPLNPGITRRNPSSKRRVLPRCVSVLSLLFDVVLTLRS